MVIHGPHDNADYDEDLGPVLVQDWFHTDYHALIEQVMAPSAEKLFPPLSNNVLINGKMNYPCDHAAADQKCTPNAGVSKFKFQSGKKYRLRLINGGAEAIQKFRYALKPLLENIVVITSMLTLIAALITTR